jgi:periplasmic protein TonB
MKTLLAVLIVVPMLLIAEKPGNGVTRPKIIEKVEPTYTEEAREAKLEGTVLLDATIDIDGKAKNITVARGLGLGLDEKAVEALSAWKFEPARQQKNNEPVETKVKVEINFRLL